MLSIETFQALASGAERGSGGENAACLPQIAGDSAARSLRESARAPFAGVPVVGELLALADGGRTALVIYPGQPGTAALRSRTTIDLHRAHVGRAVILIFEECDPRRPIVLGVLRESTGWPLEHRPGQVEVDIDGERMVVSAKEQLVLRCGKASITLTKAGKVLIDGTYVSARSGGMMRIKGAGVSLN
jgi:hypothetical protein